MARRCGLLLACLSLLLTGCSALPWWPVAEPSASPDPSTAAPVPSGSPVAITELAVGARNTTPAVPAADVDALVRGNTDFALDLYRRLAATSDENVALGPYSISSAFALLNAGAAGRTQEQIDTALHFGLPVSRLDAAFDALSIDLESRQRPALTLATTNWIFGQQGYPFLDSYLRELTTNFGAPIAVADFRHEPELDRRLINAWAAGKTHGRIKQLLPPGSIGTDTRFVLVNAMYLHAAWLDQFPSAATRMRPFHLPDGSSVDVPTMSEIAMAAQVHIGDGYQAIELPYVGGQLSMLVVMPSDLESFERTLSSDTLSGVIGSLGERELWVQLPTFSTRTSLSLRDVLIRMGMTDAFDGHHADLSRMLDQAALAAMKPPETPAVGDAIHQAWLKVTELGTEAAASTAIIGTMGGGPSLTMKIDHPFLWFVRDRDTGTILFMGRVVDPSATG